MDCTTQDFPVHHQLPELTQTHVHRVGDAINHLILCHLLLSPSIFPSIRVFSHESVLRIRWPKYWSFSFNISPSKEYSELISFCMLSRRVSQEAGLKSDSLPTRLNMWPLVIGPLTFLLGFFSHSYQVRTCWRRLM